MSRMFRRVNATILAMLICGPFAAASANAQYTTGDAALKSRFDQLSQHGNVECSVQFENSIATMPADAKLQGSCCAPMDETRYRQQIDGLKKYSDIAEVPPDPYDIPAPLAHKLMGYYDLSLNKDEQAAYDYAMETLRYAGTLLLRVLALEGVWRPWQVPHPHPPLHRSATN